MLWRGLGPIRHPKGNYATQGISGDSNGEQEDAGSFRPPANAPFKRDNLVSFTALGCHAPWLDPPLPAIGVRQNIVS